MASVKVKVKRSGMNSELYLKKLKQLFAIETFTKIAEESLKDFIVASPTNEIAKNWSYSIVKNYNKISMIFENSTFEYGENVAIIIDVGHATASGKWIPGNNYLKEPIKKTYERINRLFMEAQ